MVNVYIKSRPHGNNTLKTLSTWSKLLGNQIPWQVLLFCHVMFPKVKDIEAPTKQTMHQDV